MARVPSYDNFQVSPTTVPQQRFDAPQFVDVSGRQAQQLGDSMQRAGETAGRIAIDMQSEANQLRVIDASNQAKEQLFNLLYDKDNGALNQKGWTALNRDSGKDLPTEYADKFGDITGQIAGSLGNDAQRKMFSQQAASMQTQLYGETQRHLAGEFKSYKISTFDATVSTAQREIALMGASGNIATNPETGRSALDEAADRIMAATREKARFAGLSQDEADVFARKALSNAHALAIGGAMEAGKTTYAASYFDKYRGQMDADDILRVQGKIDHQVNTAVALQAAGRAEQQFAGAFAPDDMTRLNGIVKMMESGGQRYGKDGKLLESPKGAKGEMQVLDGTNRDPGFGVKPAQDDSPEERARVGRDYLSAMVKRYGRIDQALAAYNAGPGTVDAAIAKSKNPKNDTGGDWYSQMPAETKKYVERGMRLYTAGEGAPPKPTEKDFVDTALASLGANPKPEQVKLATEEAKRRWELNDKAVKQRDDENVAEVQRLLWANGGNFAGLPNELVMRIPADKRDNLMKYAGDVAKGPPKTTDWGTYYMLAQKPAEELSSLNLLDYRNKLADEQFRELSNRQAAIGKKDTAAIAKDKNMMEAMSQIEGHLTDAGIFLKATEKQPGRLKTRDDFLGQVRSVISDEQNVTGKPVTVERAKQIAAQLLTKVSADPEAVLFKSNEPAWKAMARAYDDIPSSQREALIADLRKAGQEPTRSMIVDAWKKRILARSNNEMKQGNKL